MISWDIFAFALISTCVIFVSVVSDLSTFCIDSEVSHTIFFSLPLKLVFLVHFVNILLSNYVSFYSCIIGIVVLCLFSFFFFVLDLQLSIVAIYIFFFFSSPFLFCLCVFWSYILGLVSSSRNVCHYHVLSNLCSLSTFFYILLTICYHSVVSE